MEDKVKQDRSNIKLITRKRFLSYGIIILLPCVAVLLIWMIFPT